ncbi:MAG: replication-relaxation family protein [Candidatus Eremiobacteraeota bacterium]|nr:replication-relaxation family protein [Candidatus Eremiobacteraeota bacterium]MBV8222362.1 replication-relaxation family protein [Candidatus Eremiobacteraeota bacterium]
MARRGPQTVAQLASGQSLTHNAIRQHLARLERDGLVAEASERRGPTKPSLVYSLTPEGRRLFPQRYSTLLNAVLEEIAQSQGREKVTELFHNIGRRSARKYAARFAGKSAQERVAELTAILREKGVVADYEASGDGYILREHTCPFRDTVATHPEVCSVVHALMEEVLPAKAEQRQSIARGDDACEFAIPVPATATATGGR